VLDSTKCISYLTIELKGPIPGEFHAKLGNRVFGCDICQEVCPFNIRRATPAQETAFRPREATTGRTLVEIAKLSEEAFREQFRGSAVKRAKRTGLIRNVEAVLSNAGVATPGQ
jgi:epoxyqueuosine reductase